jgi:hypothetical protein
MMVGRIRLGKRLPSWSKFSNLHVWCDAAELVRLLTQVAVARLSWIPHNGFDGGVSNATQSLGGAFPRKAWEPEAWQSSAALIGN